MRPVANAPKFKFSLKQRIWLIFCGVMTLAVLALMSIQVQQARNSAMGAQIAADTRQQIALGAKILETLAEIDRSIRAGDSPRWEVDSFREMVRSYAGFADGMRSEETQQILSRLDFKFKAYLNALSRYRLNQSDPAVQAVIHSTYQDIATDVATLTKISGDTTWRTLQELRASQQSTQNFTVVILILFVLLALLGGYLVVSVITTPLTSLVDFLDRVNVEDDLPESLPALKQSVPEISLVAKSFEQLLQRLRGYRTLNVRRLLIEKRRADIVAASITDGIFLLRGDEVLYLNPVAEQILDLERETRRALSGRGMGLPGVDLRILAEPVPPVASSEDGAALPASGPGSITPTMRSARAILSAISQTIPVELTLEQDDRKSYYLIQAFPISYDLIERVEDSVKGPVEQVLERFQANTLVVAQDVTLVRESQEAKGHFLATLSHEIKTPVTSLTMATRLLNKTIDKISDPTQRSLILTCVEDVDRLRRLLDDLLTVSRFDALTQLLEVQNVDLVKLLKNSVQTFQLQAREKGLSLTFTATGTEPVEGAPGAHPAPIRNVMLAMDATKIAWAVSNLLVNALRHTPRGGSVEVILSRANDEWVEIKIKDTGPGIDRRRQSRIFDKFSPFYDLRVARSGSAGVGLSIAREIITAHGGRIWVSSEVGKGAEFCFTLPLKKRRPDAESEAVGATGGLIGGSLAMNTVANQFRSEKGVIGGTTARSG